MNSEEEDMVIIVEAMNLIKRKQPKKYKISHKKTSIGQNRGYSVGFLLAYTALLLRNSRLKAKALINFFYK